jgi:hypothetical protein
VSSSFHSHNFCTIHLMRHGRPHLIVVISMIMGCITSWNTSLAYTTSRIGASLRQKQNLHRGKTPYACLRNTSKETTRQLLGKMTNKKKSLGRIIAREIGDVLGLGRALCVFQHSLDMFAAKPTILRGHMPSHDRNERDCAENNPSLRTVLDHELGKALIKIDEAWIRTKLSVCAVTGNVKGET